MNKMPGLLFTSDIIKLSIPTILLVVAGLFDDKLGLTAKSKLIIQFATAFLCWFLGYKFRIILGFELPSYISLPLTLIWIVGCINAFNLIDGLDGLAAGLAIISSTTMFIVLLISSLNIEALIMLCLGASCLGFLKYNFHPAKIFMGDTGSMFIGFIFAVISITSSNKMYTFAAVLIPILAAGIPIFDTILAIWRRLAKKILNYIDKDKDKDKDKIMSGDKEHLHHRILNSNSNQKTTTIILYLISCLFALMAIIYLVINNKYKGIFFFIILVVVFSVIKRLATIEMWNSTQIALHGLKKPKRSVLLVFFHPLLDFIFITFSFLLSFYLVFFNYNNILPLAARNIIVFVILLNFTKTYRIFWLRASSKDYYNLAKILFLATLISFLVNIIFPSSTHYKHFITQSLLFYLLSSFFILGERMLIYYIKFEFAKKVFIPNKKNKNLKNVLIYGAGLNAKFYIQSIQSNFENYQIKIIGFIDDEPALCNHYVYGHKVLGSLNSLEELIKNKNIDKIIVTIPNISDERKSILNNYVNKYDLTLQNSFMQLTANKHR